MKLNEFVIKLRPDPVAKAILTPKLAFILVDNQERNEMCFWSYDDFYMHL